ncbi:MAG: sterol carrier family protein [Mycobacterium sp.]
MSRRIDPRETRESVLAVSEWIAAATESHTQPDRTAIATAVRLTARTLAAMAPGASVEVRVPPFVAVQCVAGPRHTRGTPPNVVETDPRTWLRLACGLISLEEAAAVGLLTLSGARAAEIAVWFPLVSLAESTPE